MQVIHSLLCTSVEILPSGPYIFPKSVGFSPYFTKEIVYLQKELTKMNGILNISFINKCTLFLRSYFNPAQYYPAFIPICLIVNNHMENTIFRMKRNSWYGNLSLMVHVSAQWSFLWIWKFFEIQHLKIPVLTCRIHRFPVLTKIERCQIILNSPMSYFMKSCSSVLELLHVDRQ